jgi:hypothetical protein
MIIEYVVVRVGGREEGGKERGVEKEKEEGGREGWDGWMAGL